MHICIPSLLSGRMIIGVLYDASLPMGISPAQVVRERRPCHLYFDLEFVPAANPGVDGAALVPRLLDLLEATLR